MHKTSTTSQAKMNAKHHLLNEQIQEQNYMKNTTSLLFTFAISCLLLFDPGSAFATDYWPMIVRGGAGVTTSYGDGVLTVSVRKAHVAAGDSLHYGQLPVGSAAWVDRALNANEPFYLKQTIDYASARAIMNWLRGNEGYWKFFCANTGSGYFDVLRSEKTSKSVKFD
jgi:hypothetical protein